MRICNKAIENITKTFAVDKRNFLNPVYTNLHYLNYKSTNK